VPKVVKALEPDITAMVDGLLDDVALQLAMRIAGEHMTIGVVDIPKGDSMMLLIAAAHRDPESIERPDEFDPNRAAIRHLGFGKGPHFCLGAPLARLEPTDSLGMPLGPGQPPAFHPRKPRPDDDDICFHAAQSPRERACLNADAPRMATFRARSRR
jgi:hypothetical protein